MWLLTGQYGTLWVSDSLCEGGLSEGSHPGEAGLVLRECDLHAGTGVLVPLLFAL